MQNGDPLLMSLFSIIPGYHMQKFYSLKGSLETIVFMQEFVSRLY